MYDLTLHIGRRVKEVFESRPRSCSINWFAERLHCKRANVYNIFNRPTLDTQLLYRISQILEHDFFRDLTDELLRSADGAAPVRTAASI